MGNRAVIAGAGTMGASLAQVYAQGGWETVLYNRSQSGLERARRLIDMNQAAMVEAGFLSAERSAAVKAAIRMTTDKAVFARADLVVENIVEDLQAKQAFWAEISALTPEGALLATNTSGLHISDIAKTVHLPERFMGQHWLNPPHLLPLCELVVGERTSQRTVQRMRAIVDALGKMPVTVKDISGFLANRLQFAMLREALYIVESGAATAEDVDTVLRAGLGLRYAALGPLAVVDHGGVDIFSRITEYLNADLCASGEGSGLMRRMVAEGRLGVKSGAGFYDYSGGKADEAICQRDRLYIELAKVLYFRDGKEEG